MLNEVKVFPSHHIRAPGKHRCAKLKIAPHAYHLESLQHEYCPTGSAGSGNGATTAQRGSKHATQERAQHRAYECGCM